LVLEAADQLDRFGNKRARGILAMAKVPFSSFSRFPDVLFFHLKHKHAKYENLVFVGGSTEHGT
jgi:hypothetical protein